MLDVLKDWLGDGGKIVDRELAERRADVCAKCPLNTAADWWERLSKDPIAIAIKKTLELKNSMNIGVNQEQSLFICSACGCSARLKVHVPIEHITRHTSADTLTRFHPNCWILKERQPA